MSCPLFVDYTRECTEDVKVIPIDTFQYCASEKYPECPFYKVTKKIGPACENIIKCAAFAHFKERNFEDLVEISKTYCFSENKVNCKRYILKASGETVPIDLHPDGSKIKINPL